MSKKPLYIAAYDISHPKRLRRALNVVRDYACGGQKSVHECFLSPVEHAALLDRVGEVIKKSEDRFILIRISGQQPVQTLGTGLLPADTDFIFIG